VILKAVLTVQRVLPLGRFGALLAYAFAVTSEAMEAIIAGQKSEGEGGRVGRLTGRVSRRVELALPRGTVGADSATGEGGLGKGVEIAASGLAVRKGLLVREKS
jgi:hypothetical protein